MAHARQNLKKRINTLKVTESRLQGPGDEMKLAMVRGEKSGLRLRAKDEKKDARKARNKAKARRRARK